MRHVAVRWRGIEVEVLLLHILAVIALVAGKADRAALSRMGSLTVPKGQTKTNHLMAVANAAETIFAPSIGT